MTDETDSNSIPSAGANGEAAPAVPTATKPTRLTEVGPYDILGKLGQGGMGAVYKARQKSLDRIVALKILPPSIAKDAKFTERFQREARASARLNHPNIVQGIDVGKCPATGLWYFAMEYVDGPTLKKILADQKVIPEERALAIVKEVAKALETIGAHQMVHRDIKPDNILLTQRGEAKLADLGLAKQLNDDASLTQSGQTVGTPHYMAPEQVRGKFEECDIRSDIYALGATLFHLVTGQTPFIGETSAVIMAKHLTEAPPKAHKVNPAVSEQCSRMIEKMMQKKIELRLQTPALLIQQIDKILNKEATTGPLHAVHSKTTGPRAPIERKRESEEEAPRSRSGSNAMMLYVAGGVAAIAVLAFLLKGSPAKPDTLAENKTKPAIGKSGERSAEMKGPDGTKPESVKAPAPKPPTVNPEELFKAAHEFEQKNPDAYVDLSQRYQRAAHAAKGTPQEQEIQDKVDDALTALQARQNAAVDKAWKGIEEKVQGLVAIGNYDEALAAYQDLPPKLAPALHDKAEEKSRALHQEAEAKISEITKKVEALAADIEPGEALKTLAEAEKLAYAPTQGIVATLKKKLTADLANEADLKQKKAQLVSEKRLAEVLQKFDQALLETRDLKAAQEIAADAKKDPALAPVEPMVRAMGEITNAFDDAGRFEQDALVKLIGQKLELETATGIIKGTAAKIQDGAISLRIDFGGGASGEKKVKLLDLTEAYRKKLFPAYNPQTDAQRVAQCYNKLAKGSQDFVGAVEMLVIAPDFPLTPHCRELADKMRASKEKILAEAAAPAIWGEIQVRASAPKSSDADAKVLLEKITAFEKEYGATAFAATIKDKLDALKAKIARAASPNLLANGDFEKGSLEGWETKGGSRNADIASTGAHAGRFAMQINVQPDYNVSLIQAVTVEPHSEYRVSCWIKLLKGEIATRTGVYVLDGEGAEKKDGDGHSLQLIPLVRVDEWVKVEFKFVPENANVRLELFFRQRSKATERFTLLVDDVEFSRSTQGKSTASALPPAPVPELFKALGLVFWVNPTSDPAGTSRELLSNSMATDKGTVSMTTDSGIKSLVLQNSFATYPATEPVKSVTSNGSAFVWVKIEKLPSAWGGMLCRGDLLPGQKGHADLTLFLNHEKFMLWFNFPENAFPGIDGKTSFSSKRPPIVGKWMMLGATWDGKTITLWMNGERDGVFASPASPLHRPFPEVISLGCDPAGSPEYFNGLLGSAMIFQRALSEFEIKGLYAMSNIAGK